MDGKVIMNLEDYNTMQMDLETRRRQIGNMEAQIQAFHDMDIFEIKEHSRENIEVVLASAGKLYFEKMAAKHPNIEFKDVGSLYFWDVGKRKPVTGGDA
jgi:hypothetical protein